MKEHNKHDACCDCKDIQEESSKECKDHDNCECGSGKEREDEQSEKKRYIMQIVLSAVLTGGGTVLPVSDTIKTVLYVLAYLVVGYDIIIKAVKDICNKQPFTENLLMSIATVGAFAIGEHIEAVAVMLLFKVGELMQDIAVGNSRRSITDLVNMRPDSANILHHDGNIDTVPLEQVHIGQIAVVYPGERIPLDGVIIEGQTTINTAAITGESLPRNAMVGDDIIGGCINLTGLIKAEIKQTSETSTVGRILEVVEKASESKSQTQSFITKFARYYTPSVIGAALLIIIVSVIFGGFEHISDYIYRAMVFLTISCPCALVISVPLGYFGGIGGASKQGVLFKGANYLDTLGNVKTVVFDKTGTLTTGKLSVVDQLPQSSVSRDAFLEFICAAEYNSLHPIAKTIVSGCGGSMNVQEISEFSETAGRGVSVLYKGKKIIAGNRAMMKENNIDCPEIDTPHSVVFAATDGQYIGAVVVGDTVKREARDAILRLRDLGVRHIAVLSGDRQDATAAVAQQVGADSFTAELLPQEKAAAYEKLVEMTGAPAAFVGDGINDAPVLAVSDVGVAMGALGSDAALDAADVVLMDDSLLKLPQGIACARRTKKIVTQNIIFSIAVKAAVLIPGAFGYMSLWLAVVADTGTALLAILNSLRALKQSRQ